MFSLPIDCRLYLVYFLFFIFYFILDDLFSKQFCIFAYFHVTQLNMSFKAVITVNYMKNNNHNNNNNKFNTSFTNDILVASRVTFIFISPIMNLTVVCMYLIFFEFRVMFFVCRSTRIIISLTSVSYVLGR